MVFFWCVHSRRTNDLVFDIEMVKSGEQFYIPRIILQFLFNFKETKPWSVNVEAVTEAVCVLFRFLVPKLNYRRDLKHIIVNIEQRPLYFLCICRRHKDRLLYCYYFGSCVYSAQNYSKINLPTSNSILKLILRHNSEHFEEECAYGKIRSQRCLFITNWQLREYTNTPWRSRACTTEFCKGHWFSRKQYIPELLLFRLCVPWTAL